MCFSWFGIEGEHVPYKCINTKEKCVAVYCNQCVVNLTQGYNGTNKKFRCMYCLLEYDRDKRPEKDESLMKQLFANMDSKYGISRTSELVKKNFNRNNINELRWDIECRRNHLANLISKSERFPEGTEALNNALTMVQNLSFIETQMKQDDGTNMNIYRDLYKELISKSDCDHDNICWYYVCLSERLLAHVSDAEFYVAFPNTYKKMKDWNLKLASTDQFQLQFRDLFSTMEKDLNSLYTNVHAETIRVKIGIIGYTGVGKSTLTNRLLNVEHLTRDISSSVRSIKSTYHQLQFDRKDPLIHPDIPEISTYVTLVDIQGHDKDKSSENHVKPGNYLDEIHKADCDIYIVVFTDKLSSEEQNWIHYIKETLKRRCIIVRSKVDCEFLQKFLERSGKCFGESTSTERNQWTSGIIDDLRWDNKVESHQDQVYLIAADYMSSNPDAKQLLRSQSFDQKELVDELGRSAFDGCNPRIHSLAMRMWARVINNCFRRGNVLNVLHYKIGAGVAAVVPFGDQVPRYLARCDIDKAFGITEEFCNYLTSWDLTVNEGYLQTSPLKNCIKTTTITTSSYPISATAVFSDGAFVTSAAALSDDVVRVVAPESVLRKEGMRILFVAATIGLRIVTPVDVCALAAINSGKHIFGYINRLCDDLIAVGDPLIEKMIDNNIKEH